MKLQDPFGDNLQFNPLSLLQTFNSREGRAGRIYDLIKGNQRLTALLPALVT